MPKKEKKVNRNFFLETEDFGAMKFVCEMCIQNNETGLIYGSPGIGKTIAVSRIVQQYPEAVLIECYKGINILRSLAKSLNLTTERRGEHLFESVRDHLKLRPLPVFVDEAETLSYTNLEWLRRLQDFCQMPLILVGTETLYDNLMGSRGQRRQLYRRVRAKWIMQGMTKQELENTCTEYGYRGHEKIRKIAGNNFDRVCNLLNKMAYFAELRGIEINAIDSVEVAKFIIV